MSTKDSPGDRLTRLADEIRGLATAGLHYGTDPYDLDRYERLLTISAQLLALSDPREAGEIETAFRGALGLLTPSVAAAAAIFDSDGRALLTRRADNGRWCFPGGAAEIGESPSETAVRETFEETGLRVKPVALIGVYDSRRVHRKARAFQHYSLLFAAERTGGEPTVTPEVTEFAWCTEPEALALDLTKSTRPKVPNAFAWYDERGAAYFD